LEADEVVDEIAEEWALVFEVGEVGEVAKVEEPRIRGEDLGSGIVVDCTSSVSDPSSGSARSYTLRSSTKPVDLVGVQEVKVMSIFLSYRVARSGA
jgi:hypothetical protein